MTHRNLIMTKILSGLSIAMQHRDMMTFGMLRGTLNAGTAGSP
jgi:hypothetical protein